jgi:hypothetical protein
MRPVGSYGERGRRAHRQNKNKANKRNKEKRTMNKRTIMITAAFITAGLAGIAGAAEVSAGVDFASAYIFRGATLNKGLVMQPYAEISGFPIDEKYGALAIGTWANYDISDNSGTLESGEFSEIDYYIAYSLPVTVVDLGIAYTEYTYPNGGTSDKEVAFSVGKELGESGFYTGLTANYGLDGAPEKSWYIQGALDYGMDLSEALSLSAGVSVGYAVVDSGTDGFNDATASVGLSYALTENWALNGSLVYVAQLDDDVLTDAAYDKSGYATLGLSCDF